MTDMQTQTDVEVLKTEINGLRGSLTEIAAKIDFLISMQVQIVRLETQQDNHRRDIDAAHTLARNNTDQINGINAYVHKALGGLRVVLLCLTLIGGVAHLFIADKINTLTSVLEDVKVIDRRLTVMESRVWPDTSGGTR